MKEKDFLLRILVKSLKQPHNSKSTASRPCQNMKEKRQKNILFEISEKKRDFLRCILVKSLKQSNIFLFILFSSLIYLSNVLWKGKI